MLTLEYMYGDPFNDMYQSSRKIASLFVFVKLLSFRQIAHLKQITSIVCSWRCICLPYHQPIVPELACSTLKKAASNEVLFDHNIICSKSVYVTIQQGNVIQLIFDAMESVKHAFLALSPQ